MFKVNNSRKKFLFRAKPARVGSLFCSFPRILSGVVGLKVTSAGLIPLSSLSAFYQEINKKIKRSGFCHFFAFPNQMKTFKVGGTRMGQGKGRDLLWCCKTSPGMLLCTVSAPTRQIGLNALLSAKRKLNVSSSIVLF